MYGWESFPKGHTWKTITFEVKGGGTETDVDIFAFTEGDYHNGPRCSVCGYGFCHHCLSEPAIECPGNLMEEK
jgi:hypothetical protein